MEASPGGHPMRDGAACGWVIRQVLPAQLGPQLRALLLITGLTPHGARPRGDPVDLTCAAEMNSAISALRAALRAVALRNAAAAAVRRGFAAQNARTAASGGAGQALPPWRRSLCLTGPAWPAALRPSPHNRACPGGRTCSSCRPPRPAGRRDSPPADSR